MLANLTPWALDVLLAEQSLEQLRRGAARQVSTWGAFTFYLGVLASALPAQADHFQIVQREDVPLGEGNSVFVSVSEVNDATRAPQGYRALTLSTHTRIEPW